MDKIFIAVLVTIKSMKLTNFYMYNASWLPVILVTPYLWHVNCCEARFIETDQYSLIMQYLYHIVLTPTLINTYSDRCSISTCS